ncbi:hypothetical protein LY78DRAFT_680653 [Colletotrichum sublineola]|uniref:Uncharacterized protein n=1 Tax=Colletotrichum sublineola TaxID=1173701 RepID=A0A066XR79_COLSU|nr:hypothetical protein LY78DRAFT_680653 [Colletotrichum sublineola]KDN70174.1 hypothetical protein CSUB01_11905 [Colletotrichum sublineola]
MATTTTTSETSQDWLEMKKLLFKDDTYLQKLSSNGLFLFLIGRDLADILDGETKRDFHLLLTLAHGKEKMSDRLPKTLAADDDLMVSLKASLRDGGKMDETRSVLKIDADGTTVHLHLHGLLHPGAIEGEISVSSASFVTDGVAHTETMFLSTHDLSKPASTLEFCQVISTSDVDGLAVQLPKGVYPDRVRAWILKK